MKKPCFTLLKGLLFAAITFSFTIVDVVNAKKCPCVAKRKQQRELRRRNLAKTIAIAKKNPNRAKQLATQQKVAVAKYRTEDLPDVKDAIASIKGVTKKSVAQR